MGGKGKVVVKCDAKEEESRKCILSKITLIFISLIYRSISIKLRN